MARALPPAAWGVSACWFLAASADALLLFVVLWSAGPLGWSGVETALVILALRLPALAGGALAGRIIDTLGARTATGLDAAFRAALFATLASVGWEDGPSLPAVLSIGALAGGVAPLSYAGARSWIAGLVPAEDLGQANAVLSLGDLVPTVVGGALVGPALALLGPGPVFLLPAAMLTLACMLALRLPPGAAAETAPPESDTPAGSAASEQRRHPPAVIALVGLSCAYFFAFGPFETVLPTLVREQLGGDEDLYGMLWMVFGLSAIATLPLAPSLARWRPGMANAVGAAAWGLIMLPVAFVTTPWAAILAFLLGGAVWGPYTAIEATALHRWTPPSRYGEIFGIQRGLLSVALPLGAAAGALALEFASASAVIGASCGACALAGVFALPATSAFRNSSSQPWSIQGPQ